MNTTPLIRQTRQYSGSVVGVLTILSVWIPEMGGGTDRLWREIGKTASSLIAEHIEGRYWDDRQWSVGR